MGFNLRLLVDSCQLWQQATKLFGDCESVLCFVYACAVVDSIRQIYPNCKFKMN